MLMDDVAASTHTKHGRLGIAALIDRCDYRFIHHKTRVLSDQVQ
jgi:hypothetical protein